MSYANIVGSLTQYSTPLAGLEAQMKTIEEHIASVRSMPGAEPKKPGRAPKQAPSAGAQSDGAAQTHENERAGPTQNRRSRAQALGRS